MKEAFSGGYVTKSDFEKAMRAHKEAKDDMMSDQRKAAAAYYAQAPGWGL